MQCIRNLSAVLTEAGSSLQNVVRVGVFLTDMGNFAAMNRVYETMFKDPKPVSGGDRFLTYIYASLSSSSLELISQLTFRGGEDLCGVYKWMDK